VVFPRDIHAIDYNSLSGTISAPEGNRRRQRPTLCAAGLGSLSPLHELPRERKDKSRGVCQIGPSGLRADAERYFR
jgi:hypothetical protein